MNSAPTIRRARRYRAIGPRTAPAPWLEPSKSRNSIIAHNRVAHFFALALVITFSVTAAGGAQENAPSEYELKAAFLYNFAKFIDWPPSSFAGRQAPFAICILGVDPFGLAIDETLRGKTIGEHPVVVRRVAEASEARNCQIVFVSSQEKQSLSEILASLRGRDVLTVGETSDFAVSGGAIQFQIEQSRIRFAINTDAAESAGLHISSKLLALAKIVHAPPSGRS